VIALQGLNILSGYCGQISIGHTAFMAVGAYSTAILSGRYGIPFWLCLPCSGLLAGFVGVLFGLPSLRIKGYYLALTTIAAQFIIIYLIKNPFPEITGGAIALHVPDITLGKFIFESESRFYYLIIGLALLMTYFAKSMMRSHMGRAFIAIRDNDIAAEAMGINLYKYKLQAFFIGCFYAGVAGSMWAAYSRVISPDDFTLSNSIWQMGMLIVGGLGSTLGPIFGALFIKLLNELCVVAGPLITSLVPQIGAQFSAALIEMTFGATIVLFLVYEPRGIAHRWEITKESYRLWPFSY
jgi:branched-chain amino acid transport system permease protein